MTEAGGAETTLDDLLADVSDLRRFRDAFVSIGPTASSPAATDGVVPFGGLVLAHGATTLGVGLDHLEAWASLYLDARVLSPYAPFTLIRASLEGTILCRWLIDSAATSEVRAARAASLHLRDLGEHRTAMTEANVPAVSVNMTALFNDNGPGEWAYRILSGIAHGYMSAAMLISRDDGAMARDSEVEGVVTARRLPNMLAATSMTNAARNFMMIALRDLSGLLRPRGNRIRRDLSDASAGHSSPHPRQRLWTAHSRSTRPESGRRARRRGRRAAAALPRTLRAPPDVLGRVEREWSCQECQ